MIIRLLPSSIIKIGKIVSILHWLASWWHNKILKVCFLAISNNQGKKFKRYSNAPIFKKIMTNDFQY